MDSLLNKEISQKLRVLGQRVCSSQAHGQQRGRGRGVSETEEGNRFKGCNMSAVNYKEKTAQSFMCC